MIKVNGKEVKTFNFSGGEVNPTLPEGLKSGPFKILAHLQSSDAIMNLLMVVDAIKRNFGDYDISVVVPYLPYARQDRLCNQNEAVGLNVILKILSDNVDTITTIDVHNFDACKIGSGEKLKIQNILSSHVVSKNSVANENTVLVAPDAGSTEKVFTLAKILGLEYIQGKKLRNTSTGKLSGFGVDTLEVDCEGKELLIVDDICDGGGTFLGLYDELTKLKPKKVDLYVTHGIFSKGYDALLEKFDTLYTTDTFLKDHHKDVQIIKVIDNVQI